MKASKPLKASKPTVFVSFNSKDSKFVDSLVREVERTACIIRYEDGVSNWGNFKTFMNGIRQQDFVVLVLSDKYLKSQACMYEVLALMCECDWRRKTMFVIMNNDINIYTTDGRHKYVLFWHENCTDLITKISSLPRSSTSELQKDLVFAQEVRDHIDDFLHIVADTKNPPLYTVIPNIKERLEEEHAKIVLELAAAAEASQKIRKNSPNQQRVIEILCIRDRVTCQSTAVELDITIDAARYALEQLVKKGIAQRSKRNRQLFYTISV